MKMIKLDETEEETSRRRRERIEELRRQKRRAEYLRKRVYPAIAGGMLLLVVLIVILVKIFGGKNKTEVQEPVVTPAPSVAESSETPPEATPIISLPEVKKEPFSAVTTSATKGFSDEITSTNGIVIDIENKTILAQKDANARIVPASMTKILTVLVAAKQLGITEEDYADNPTLKDTFTITREITDYSFVNDCSNVGFEVGEAVPVKDLFFGTIMPSGADAALGLAYYVAGSQEEFMVLMNEELKELGLSATSHFTNCIGLYNADHYSTVYDIAVIMKEAMDIPFVREVLSQHVYEIEASELHPDGIVLSNLFLRRIEDRDTHGEVLGAKTGYVVQSKNCAASLGKDKNGKEYIIVTVGGTDKWKCIADHTLLYQTWLPE